MVLTNEQRAHDIAIANIPFAFEEHRKHEQRKLESKNGTEAPLAFNIYVAYKTAYDALLHSINNDSDFTHSDQL